MVYIQEALRWHLFPDQRDKIPKSRTVPRKSIKEKKEEKAVDEKIVEDKEEKKVIKEVVEEKVVEKPPIETPVNRRVLMAGSIEFLVRILAILLYAYC